MIPLGFPLMLRCVLGARGAKNLPGWRCNMSTGMQSVPTLLPRSAFPSGRGKGGQLFASLLRARIST